jgi:hypothetical protein
MPKYRVEVRETVVHEIEVEASSAGQAQSIAYEHYCDFDENNLGDNILSHKVESEGTEGREIDIYEIVES